MDRDATLGSILRSHDSRMQPIGMEFMSSHNTPSLRGDLRLTISMYEIGHLEECLDRARVIRAYHMKNWSVCYVLRISNDGFNALNPMAVQRVGPGVSIARGTIESAADWLSGSMESWS